MIALFVELPLSIIAVRLNEVLSYVVILHDGYDLTFTQ